MDVDSIVQSIATIISGSIIGLIFQWKLALVGIACIPLLISTGFIRLVYFFTSCWHIKSLIVCLQRVVVLKDQYNKKAHDDSAQLAIEAAGAIRTVASLTREEDCLNLYSQSLEEPLKRSNRTAFWSNLLFASSQAMMMFVIALVFWYGSQGVSKREYGTTAFFVCLFVSAIDLLVSLYKLFYLTEYRIRSLPDRRYILICARYLVC